MGTLTGSAIGAWASNIFYGILLTIDYVIYLAINICYHLFEVVSEIEVFSAENVGAISRRIYTIIGIVMLFVFAYNIILAIVEPDSLSKGEKSVKNIVQNTIISVILVTLFPLICEYMQTFQNHIVDNNTIGNLIMGSTAGNKDTSSALNVSVTIFTAFYHPLNENGEPVTLVECANSSAKLCSTYTKLAEGATNNMIGLHKFMLDDDLINGIYDDDMEYLFPLSTIAGVVAAYLFLSFSLDLGVRAAKLGALKLIAPIPIFLRITKPKGGQFDKWFSEFIKTYLQVFERILIINFAMLLISFVSKAEITITEESDISILIKAVAVVVVILGILKFAKDAPKLIEDIFSVKIPQMSLKKKLNDNEYALRGASMLGAAGTTAVGNVIKGIGQGKGFGGVLKTGLGGLIGGGRQGWVQSRGLNDISKLKDTIVGARATADEHRDDRLAVSRELQEDWLTKQIKDIKNEHKDWSDAQVEQYIKDHDIRNKAKWHGTVFDRVRDDIKTSGKDFVDYMSSGNDAVLQRSLNNQTNFKNTVSSFLKNVANKSSYENVKKGRDSLIADSYQGKLSKDELMERIKTLTGKDAFLTNDKNKIFIDGIKYDFGTATQREDTIKKVYNNLLSAEQAKSLAKLGREGCADYAKSLSKEFEQIALTIVDEKQRDKISGMVNNLVTLSKKENIDYAAFANMYSEIESALTNSINKTQAKLILEQKKKDGK